MQTEERSARLLKVFSTPKWLNNGSSLLLVDRVDAKICWPCCTPTNKVVRTATHACCIVVVERPRDTLQYKSAKLLQFSTFINKL